MKTKKFTGDRIFDFVNVTVILLITIIILVPLLNVLASSFSGSTALAEGGFIFFPKEWSLDNYRAVFKDTSIWKAFFISVAKTVIGVVTHVFFCAMVAFVFIRLFGIAVARVKVTFYFTGFQNADFFRQIPASLEESAQIDGAGVWKIFLSIAMPLSKPALATIALFNGVYQWNDFMTAKLYMTNKDLYPVQMKLYEIIVQQQAQSMNSIGNVALSTTSKGIQLATIVVTTVPIIIIYPLLQKHFVSGMMLGAVKE